MLHQISLLETPFSRHIRCCETQHKTLGMDNQIFKINPDKHDDGGEEKKREKKVVKLVCVSLPPFDIKNPLKNS
jgi:hypothetical protein